MRQRGGVTDIVNSCLRPSNNSLWIFLSFLCLFNKELTSQGQILKNIHYFFFFLFTFLIVILLWRLLRSKFKPHEGTAAWSFCVFFLIFIFKFFSLFFPTYKKVAELSVGFFFLMVKSLVCFFFLLEAFISRTCLSHSEASGGPRVSILLSLSHSLSHSVPPTLG